MPYPMISAWIRAPGRWPALAPSSTRALPLAHDEPVAVGIEGRDAASGSSLRVLRAWPWLKVAIPKSQMHAQTPGQGQVGGASAYHLSRLTDGVGRCGRR